MATDPGARSSPLSDILDPIAPEIKKWASVAVIESLDGPDVTHWYHLRGEGAERDFWPASTIKLYAAVAALEKLAACGMGTASVTVMFERQLPSGRWVLDAARSIGEMLSETFRRSSNEDYTLLLRITGVDWINTHFLTPEKGFPHSALMRGYVPASARPYAYILSEPQRITIMDAVTQRTERWTHRWSGHSYSADRGATIIDEKTGNVTSTFEAVECLRRVLLHDELAPSERYALSPEQHELLLQGKDGFCGLRVTGEDSGPYAWKSAASDFFPQAAFYHKCGLISNYAMDLAAVDDRAHSGKRFLLMPVIQAGHATEAKGEALVSLMARALCQAIKDGRL